MSPEQDPITNAILVKQSIKRLGFRVLLVPEAVKKIRYVLFAMEPDIQSLTSIPMQVHGKVTVHITGMRAHAVTELIMTLTILKHG